MDRVNKFGLSRNIPAEKKREVRRRSKFGCVVCRNGFYQIEHIDPTFENAKKHDPSNMCCLCGSCHDSVTRGHISKAMIKRKYSEIQNQNPESIVPPTGPLDFHEGSAELAIGGIFYHPAVQTILRYDGHDIIRVAPGQNDEPGSISAIFTDDEGIETLQLVDNEWVGSLQNWDIEVKGPRITIRKKLRDIALQLRLDPPGRLVVEQLDMRIGSGHLIANENNYAVGRYIEDNSMIWVHVGIRINSSTPEGVAIEFTDPSELEILDHQYLGHGAGLATPDRFIVMNYGSGAMVKPLGIVIGGRCGAFGLYRLAYGMRTLKEMKKAISTTPEQLCEFIANGKIT